MTEDVTDANGLVVAHRDEDGQIWLDTTRVTSLGGGLWAAEGIVIDSDRNEVRLSAGGTKETGTAITALSAAVLGIALVWRLRRG